MEEKKDYLEVEEKKVCLETEEINDYVKGEETKGVKEGLFEEEENE